MAKAREYIYEEIHCPKCQAAVKSYDVANSSYFGCTNCHTFFEAVNDTPPQKIKVFSKWNAHKTSLQLGQECKIDADRYLLVGIMHKREVGDDFVWTEYVLWRQGAPYIVLVEAGADWLIVRKSAKSYTYTPGPAETIFYDEDRHRCRLEMSYKFRITHATGEFDWNILSEENNMAVFEFFGHKKVYVHETMGAASDWYVATPAEKRTIAKAFNISPNQLPRRSNYGNVNMDEFEHKFMNVWIGAFVAIAVIVIFTLLKPERNCFYTETGIPVHLDSTSNTYTPVYTSGTISYPSFVVHDNGALSINITVPGLDNSWAEASGTLVNDKTGETYDFTKAIEYYSGVEGGESWAEGSHSQEILLSSVPAGKYHINLNMTTEKEGEKYTTIQVAENVLLTSNITWAALLILVYPVILIFKRKYYNTGTYLSE